MQGHIEFRNRVVYPPLEDKSFRESLMSFTKRSFNESALFGGVSIENVNRTIGDNEELERLARLHDQRDLKAIHGEYQPTMFALLLHAFHGSALGSGGASFRARTFSHDGYDPAITMEYRRIPAQQDADEFAMWMRLLQGHAQLVHDTEGLIPLRAPKRPRSQQAKLAQFRNYIVDSSMNPQDFARFLRRRLAAKVEPSKERRWSEIRYHFECENRLMRSTDFLALLRSSVHRHTSSARATRASE